MGMSVQLPPGDFEDGGGEVDEDAMCTGVFVEDGRGEEAVAAAEIEEGADALAAGGGDELEHGLDLLDGEGDGAADGLKEFGDEIGILNGGRRQASLRS